jgi:subtilase family serine protease
MLLGREARMLKRAVLTMVILLVGGLIVQGVEELAELHVTTITLDPPSSITQGVDIEIHARVMNTGQRSASPVNVGLFYRPMNGSSSWVLAESIDGASLAPSQEDYLEITFSLSTEALELGTYQIRIVADPLNQITEVDELNNELLTSFLLIASSLGLPDLQPVSLAYTRTNPESADDMLPWNVTTTVENPTPSQAGAFTVVFLLDGVEFDRQFLFALPSGGSVDVVGEFDPFALGLAPGTYGITVAVDPDEQVLEQDEANNSIAGALTLLSPDLYPISLSFDKTVLHLDEEMRVTTQIANGGEGTAKSVDVGFYIDHVRFALIQIPLLGRGLTTSIEAILSPDIVGLLDAPETYEIEIIVDPNQTLPELDEANNKMSRSMTILEPGVRQPELHPESFELGPASPVELGRTDTITLSTVIRNTGRATADNFSAAFYYRVKGGLRWEEIPCSGESSCSSLDLASGMQAKLAGILPVILLQPGIYEVRVLVDSDSAVDELDESNNELITSLTLLAARLPDLAFSYMQGIRIEPSTQVHRGQTIRFTPTITNMGDLDAEDFLVRFSYQNVGDAASAAQTGQQTEFRTAYFSPDSSMQVRSLAIGETAEIPVLLETRDLAPGQYLIQMEIDPAGGSSANGQVIERNENNNIISAQVAVLGPDLAALDLYTVPGGVVDQSQMDSLDVVSTIINSGVAPAGEFTVKFQLLSIDETGSVPIRIHSCGDSTDCGTPEFFGEVTLPGIGTLVPEQVRCSLDLSSVDLEPGQYVIRVLVDCQGGIGLDGMCLGQVAEHNELNNLLEIPVVITGVRAVDFEVSDLVVAPVEDSESIFTFTATVSNAGIKAAPAFNTVLRLMGTAADCEDANSLDCEVVVYAETIQLPGLGGHASYEVVWTIDLGAVDTSALDLGEAYVVQVDVDCDAISATGCQGHVDESDEANNGFQLVLNSGVSGGTSASVSNGADLTIQSFHALETSGAPSSSQIWATIINEGTEDAGEFYVVFYYLDDSDLRVDLPTARVRGLAAGADTSVLRYFDTSLLSKGYHIAGIVVDIHNDVPETNEGNNSRETDLSIR